MPTQPTSIMMLTDYALQQRLVEALESSTKLLAIAAEQLGNTRLYEEDAAKLMGVEKRTMLQYRKRGLPYEKVGNIISYRRKDLDDWRSQLRTRDIDVSQ